MAFPSHRPPHPPCASKQRQTLSSTVLARRKLAYLREQVAQARIRQGTGQAGNHENSPEQRGRLSLLRAPLARGLLDSWRLVLISSHRAGTVQPGLELERARRATSMSARQAEVEVYGCPRYIPCPLLFLSRWRCRAHLMFVCLLRGKGVRSPQMFRWERPPASVCVASTARCGYSQRVPPPSKLALALSYLSQGTGDARRRHRNHVGLLWWA